MLNNIVTNNHASSRLVNLRLQGPGQFFYPRSTSTGFPCPKKTDGRPRTAGAQHTRSSMPTCCIWQGALFPVAPCGGSSDLHLLARDTCHVGKTKGARDPAQSNRGIGECQCAPSDGDGDGDARTILRALAGGPPPTGFTCS